MKRIWLTITAPALFAAACGGGSTTTSNTEAPDVPATPAETAEPPSSEPDPATTAATGPAAATSLEEVKAAVVRIVGTGTFADPAGGVQANVPGSGSGFIIDPTGIAVTNNHVVTGAAVLDVFIADGDTPLNARVLGVSECSDLAVIQLPPGEYDYLDWHDGAVTAGMDVFAAGFPLGDAEYTVLDGIVSKENAAGETSWASVDSVIEHSADTLPGSSGGPIVTAEGTVVAVNYAGNDLGQSFAIGIDVARPVVDQLAGGSDVDSIGINGEALAEAGFSGIFVYSVQSGSPADVAGVRPGDLVLSMESLVLATDGTMADYCDVLRSHAPTDTLTIEVYRPETDEILEGQLNGRPLEVVTSFQAQLDEVATDDAGGFEYAEYVTIVDDSNRIEVSVPVEWTADVNGEEWLSALATGVDELIGPAISASPDREAFINSWGTPGVFIGASSAIPLSVGEALDQFDFTSSCLYDGRYDYDDGVYTGLYDVYVDCGDEGSVFLIVFAEPEDRAWLAMVQIVAVTDADLTAADQVFNTFFVTDVGG